MSERKLATILEFVGRSIDAAQDQLDRVAITVDLGKTQLQLCNASAGIDAAFQNLGADALPSNRLRVNNWARGIAGAARMAEYIGALEDRRG